jgi:predicted SnoaL-like aldol condensation-catalyzing enzyme
MGITLKHKILCCISVATLLAAPACVSKTPSATPSQKDCTLSAREVVDQFIDSLFRKKEVRKAFERWVVSDYIQHKATLPDGREAVIGFLEDLFERYPGRIFTIHRVIASDDLVAVHYHSQATPQDLGFAVIDIFRVKNCRIVEHWDVVQPVPAQSANDNTMF